MDLSGLRQTFMSCKTLDKLNAALKLFLQQHAISTFAFTYYSSIPSNRNRVKYDFVSENIRAWHEYYLAQHFEEVDSELQKARQTILPVYWELKKQLKQAKTVREKQLRQDALSVNVEKGLSIPIHGPEDDFAILLLQQCQGETGLENYLTKELYWLAVGYVYYEFVRRFLLKESPQALMQNLSQRELQCLRLASQGLTANEIAKQIGLTTRTVNFHWQNINKKLGTRNKSQSIHLAQIKGLLA
ncbi:MAG: putative Transcriptional regulator, LuxR family with an autoinducer-binding domain [Gammaproteobacteria bacterium]|jgi:LuxR family transcriptional activator of bioluminescence operon|nr:putative Transcriptional regulator, LuxR family with an autoinducer-binding domain [Gammaproteobacteria bacterium]